MKNYLVFFFLIILINFYLFGQQQDIFIKYNSITAEISVLNSPFFDSTLSTEHTNWEFGTLSGLVNLPQETPSITFPGSGFTELIRADSIFNLESYPIRTAVKLFGYLNDSLIQQCSGILVGRNLVLSAGHCTCYRFDSTGSFIFLDSIIVIPAFDEGTAQINIGKTTGTIFFVPQDWYYRIGWNDISLIQLNEPIGTLTGWIGIGFNVDNEFFEENLFYKFSYPVGGLVWDSSRFFDQRYLYFNYGNIDTLTENGIGFFIDGIPGQSGSSLVFSDNSEFITFGEQVWSGSSMHKRITKLNYFILKNIINTISSSINLISTPNELDFRLEQNYPNPFNSSTTINYNLPYSGRISLKIFDMLGKEIQTIYNGFQIYGFHSIDFIADNLSSGIYFYQLICDDFKSTKKMTLLR